MSSQPVNGVPVRERLDDPDAAVVERIRQGETGLYEVLIRRYNQRMFRVARSFLHDDAEAEDVMQEAYLKAFTALPRFQGRARFSTWLTRILINCALGQLRSRSRRREVGLDTVEAGAGIAEAALQRADLSGTEELPIAKEQLAGLIESALDTLAPKYRLVFVLRELEEMSVAETASAMGISAENTKVRLHRAKRLLREELRRRMPELTLYGFMGDRCDALTRRVMERIAALSAPHGIEL